MNRVPVPQGKNVGRFYQRGDAGTEQIAQSAGVHDDIHVPDCITYNTPQLMAMAAPILSLSRICSLMRINQGRMASAMSAAPEYADVMS